MNNHIKEIAKNTAIWYVTDREDLLNDFAIAIIEECIEVLRLAPYRSLALDFDAEIPYQDAIREHFGGV